MIATRTASLLEMLLAWWRGQPVVVLIGNRHVIRCAGCDAILGMVEPAACMVGTSPWCFCSWVCLERVHREAEREAGA